MTVPSDRDAAFSRLFREEHPRIVRELQHMVGDAETARDVAQEAFVRLYVGWRKVSRYERPGAWVRRVAIRLAMNALRSRQAQRRALRRIGPPETAPTPGPEPAGGAALHRAVLGLPGAQRAAVVLHYIEDRPLREVADVLDCSEATVRVHLHRARNQLRARLHPEEVDDGVR